MSRKAVDTRKRVRVAKPFVFARLLFVFGLILLAGIALVVRIAYLNKNKGDAYERKVLAQQSYASNVLPYKRGIPCTTALGIKFIKNPNIRLLPPFLFSYGN